MSILQERRLLFGAPGARGAPGLGDYCLGVVLRYDAIHKAFSFKTEVSAQPFPLNETDLRKAKWQPIGDVGYDGSVMLYSSARTTVALTDVALDLEERANRLASEFQLEHDRQSSRRRRGAPPAAKRPDPVPARKVNAPCRKHLRKRVSWSTPLEDPSPPPPAPNPTPMEAAPPPVPTPAPETSAGPEPAASGTGMPSCIRRYGPWVVGLRVKIMWNDGQWFEGTVKEFNATHDEHYVLYDDKDVKWHHLGREEAWGQLQWLASATTSSAAAARTKRRRRPQLDARVPTRRRAISVRHLSNDDRSQPACSQRAHSQSASSSSREDGPRESESESGRPTSTPPVDEWETDGHIWIGRRVRRLVWNAGGTAAYVTVDGTITRWLPAGDDPEKDNALWWVAQRMHCLMFSFSACDSVCNQRCDHVCIRCVAGGW